MKNSIRIERIKTDDAGFKLIAYSTVSYFKGVKPWVSPCSFADYKDGVLTLFSGNSETTHSIPSFREALIFLRGKK